MWTTERLKEARCLDCGGHGDWWPHPLVRRGAYHLWITPEINSSKSMASGRLHLQSCLPMHGVCCQVGLKALSSVPMAHSISTPSSFPQGSLPVVEYESTEISKVPSSPPVQNSVLCLLSLLSDTLRSTPQLWFFSPKLWVGTCPAAKLGAFCSSHPFPFFFFFSFYLILFLLFPFPCPLFCFIFLIIITFYFINFQLHGLFYIGFCYFLFYGNWSCSCF
jgi:hypothetical protein